MSSLLALKRVKRASTSVSQRKLSCIAQSATVICFDGTARWMLTFAPIMRRWWLQMCRESDDVCIMMTPFLLLALALALLSLLALLVTLLLMLLMTLLLMLLSALLLN